jgi:hypothetical protein
MKKEEKVMMLQEKEVLVHQMKEMLLLASLLS